MKKQTSAFASDMLVISTISIKIKIGCLGKAVFQASLSFYATT